MSRSTFRKLAVGSAVFALLVLAATLILPLRPAKILDWTTTMAVAAFAMACCAVTAQRSPPGERLWRLLLGAAVFSSFLPKMVAAMQSGFSSRVLGSDVSILVPALMLYPLALAGLLTFPTVPAHSRDPSAGLGGRNGSWQLVTLLDCLLVVGALLLLGSATIIAPVLARGLGNAGSVVIIQIVGTAGKLLILIAIILIAIFRRPCGTGSLALVAAGVLISIVTDSVELYAYAAGRTQVHPAFALGFLVGRLLLGLGVAAPASGRLAAWTRHGPPALWVPVILPYVPVVGVVALVAVQVTMGTLNPPVLYGALGLVLIALLRQTVTLADNTRLVGHLRDSRDELHHQAFHDPLTGLANRALFNDRLQQAVTRHDRHGDPIAVLFCDLDDFKDVNDTLGHPAGDELLRATARRLTSSVRAADTVARLGGDEFAVLLEGPHDPAATGHRIAATIRGPCPLVGTTRTIQASIGMVVVEPAVGPLTAETLLHHADQAMYTAKRRGKGQMVIHPLNAGGASAVASGRCQVD
ncbi:GGDEF domain-containing protein [Parafrankia sp. EUN1f]|uniref:GGDEF domain-containing protein n=1 Tax=Parafrankia sp. EUN1f TaxID=102897 RepID=UPI0012FCE77C|nr:GGDEF domain-containing protein [Parafrankia sp. EUN1f]